MATRLKSYWPSGRNVVSGYRPLFVLQIGGGADIAGCSGGVNSLAADLMNLRRNSQTRN